jgi:YgiT-type zinc finger domain-containing protein
VKVSLNQNVIVMKCMYCQGEMQKGTVPFLIDREGVYISLDEIPAWVCSQCGESSFEENEVDAMQALMKAIEEQTHKFAKTA